MKGKKGETCEGNTNGKMEELAKFIHYFPLIPRLRRMYISPKFATQIGWHDAKAQRAFYAFYHDFALILAMLNLPLLVMASIYIFL